MWLLEQKSISIRYLKTIASKRTTGYVEPVPNQQRERVSGTFGYIPTLDGWRAVAILLVILRHDQVHSWMGPAGVYLQQYGSRGVDLFFALSGLLICTRLLEEERLTGTIRLKKFYLRRAFRIQPAVFIYLTTLSLLMLCGLLEYAWGGVTASFLLVRNYFPARLVSKDYYTGHIWSLSVEEHFYLFLPLFLHRVRNQGARAVTLLFLTLVLSLWRHFVFSHPYFQYGWSYVFRTDIAVSGILLASAVAVLLQYVAVRNWCLKWLRPWPVFCVVGAIWFDVDHWDRHHVLTFFTYPVLILSTSLHPRSAIARMLELAPMRYIGRISYSLYLWQMLFFRYSSPNLISHSAALAYVQSMWLRYPAALASALLSYYLFEKPFIKIGHRVTRSIMTSPNELQQSSATQTPSTGLAETPS